VLLDIGMPHLNGYEVAQAIRGTPWGAGVYLIAATGWGQEKDKKLAHEAGFDVHLTKPIDFKQLRELVENRAKAGMADSLAHSHSRASGNLGNSGITSENPGFPLSRE
jgi:CheY-like chemotaxis protein